MADYANVGAHPGMHVALHGYQDFLPREALLLGIALGRLRLVPLLVHFRQRMDIVIGRIVIDDLDLLSGHHAQYVRLVHTTFLLQLNRAGGDRPLLVRNASLHPNEHVLQRAVLIDQHLLRLLRRGMRAGAVRHSVHAEGLHDRLIAGERHFPGDGTGIGVIHRSGSRRCLFLRRFRCLRRLAAAASG